MKVLDNPSGRRIKAVVYTGEDIISKLTATIMGVGLFRSLGTQLRQRRTALKALALGTAMAALRARNAARRAALAFTVGVTKVMQRRQKAGIRATLAVTVGLMHAMARMRALRQRAILAIALGTVQRAVRLRDAARRAAVMFACGALLTDKRYGGSAPQGYVFGKIQPPKKAGPKPRIVGVEAIDSKAVADSVWAKRSAANAKAAMKMMFPDLVSVFTEKPKVVKELTEEEKKEAERKAKLVKIVFIAPPGTDPKSDEGKRNQKMGLILGRFRNLPPYLGYPLTVEGEPPPPDQKKGWWGVAEAIRVMDVSLCICLQQRCSITY
jgi:hypothetical protein